MSPEERKEYLERMGLKYEKITEPRTIECTPCATIEVVEGKNVCSPASKVYIIKNSGRKKSISVYGFPTGVKSRMSKGRSEKKKTVKPIK